MLAIVDFSQGTSVASFTEEVIRKLRYIDTQGPDGPIRVSSESMLKKVFSPVDVYDYVTMLEYVRPSFRLLFEGRDIASLSPGQRGMVLLLFYLLVDLEGIPLIVDQPEENLDNQTVVSYLVDAFAAARSRRQVIIVTHNSNLAVVCDSDQIIRANRETFDGPFDYKSGSLEAAEISRQVVDILEGTQFAFGRRAKKYSQ